MRFYNYINEKNVPIEEVVKDILWYCQPFIKDWKIKYKEEFLWSGRQQITKFDRKQIRQNRNPKDTPPELHYEIDQWFKKKFGVKARSSSLFCSFDGGLASSFGNPHIIFPIGKYKLISSNKISDIYDVLEGLFADAIGTANFYWKKVEDQGKDDEFIDKLIYELEKGNYKINQHNDNEQMLIGKDYYLYYADPGQTMQLIDLKHRLLNEVL